MQINAEKLRELLDKYCNGNYNRFARELDVDPSHLYRYLNTGVGGGKKMVGAVMRFCKDNNLNFEDYIDF